jgi:hypothetical protein
VPLARPIARCVRALDRATVDTGCGPAGCDNFVDRKRIGESDFLSMVSRSQIFRIGCRTESSSYNLTKSTPETGVNMSGRTPRVTRIPFLSTICMTRPEACTTHVRIGSNDLSRMYTRPFTSATRIPTDEGATVATSNMFYQMEKQGGCA